MDLVLTIKKAHVYDDVLPNDVFQQLWQLMNNLPYARTDAVQWTKVWSLADGAILRGPQWVAKAPDWTLNPPPAQGNQRPFPTNPPPLVKLMEKVREACASQTHLPEITGVAMLPYVWPPGTSISWHADGTPIGSGRIGAFTFYAHKQWNIEWGGEFLISEIDADAEGVSSAPTFDNSALSEHIINSGVGSWVSPKPNRMIMNPSNLLHKVSKTTEAAAPRLSIQGFIFAE